MNKEYFGDEVDKKKNGYGCFYYEQHDKFVKYFGDWKNDIQEGEGFMNYRDGTEYYGHWENGHRQGLGKFFLEDKTEI